MRILGYKQRIAINLLDLYSDSIIYTGTLSGGLLFMPTLKWARTPLGNNKVIPETEEAGAIRDSFDTDVSQG